SPNPWKKHPGPISPSYTNLSTHENILHPPITNNNNSNPISSKPLSSSASRKTPESFLGDKFINLVNLDKLLTDPNTKNKKITFFLIDSPFCSSNRALSSCFLFSFCL